VKVHDFEDKELGKVVPYGVYDLGANAGWVSVGITSDTAQFAVASIRRWLDAMGRQRYPKARELTITADGGGSNGTRVRLWKVELQKLADQTGLVLHVHHYPPGTSKWNKIEHRLFCHITQTWRGRPLVDRMAVVELIAATTTKAGLRVESALDTATYQKGIKVSNAEMRRSTSTAMRSILNGTTPSVQDQPLIAALNLTGVLRSIIYRFVTPDNFVEAAFRAGDDPRRGTITVRFSQSGRWRPTPITEFMVKPPLARPHVTDSGAPVYNVWKLQDKISNARARFRARCDYRFRIAASSKSTAAGSSSSATTRMNHRSTTSLV